MAEEAVNFRFVLLIKFGDSLKEYALKSAFFTMLQNVIGQLKK